MGGFILSIISLGLLVLGAFYAYPAFPESAASAATRSGGIFHKLLQGFFEAQPYIPLWTMFGSVAFSFISTLLVYLFFEKTQSSEILFFGFFIISLSFEFARIIIPLRVLFQFPALYLATASRLLLFSRYFGLFSIFAASIFAAGLGEQKQITIIFIMILAAMIIAINVPVDCLVWDSSLKLINGYDSMFFIVETGVLIITVITFFISAYTRSAKEYVFIGIGSFMAITGRSLLIASDSWFTLIPGILILTVGTWFICSKLHKIYLWF